MIGLPIIWRLRTLAFVALALAGFGAIECPPYELLRLRLFSFGGYGLALAALALVIFGAYDSYPHKTIIT